LTLSLSTSFSSSSTAPAVEISGEIISPVLLTSFDHAQFDAVANTNTSTSIKSLVAHLTPEATLTATTL
jgi:hypothetical protein